MLENVYCLIRVLKYKMAVFNLIRPYDLINVRFTLF